jgi:ubiquitin C-terminal hydrolase
MLNDSTKQHDAQECLRILLDALSEGELLFLDLHMDRYRKIEKCLGPQKLSIIDRMFGFYLASKVVCLKCEKISWTIDLALDL